MRMKKVFFIHQTTKAIPMYSGWVHVPSDFIVMSGYILGNDPKHIYNDRKMTLTFQNFIEEVVWEDENEACEVLIKIIEDIQENLSLNVEGQYQKLRNRKPELFI